MAIQARWSKWLGIALVLSAQFPATAQALKPSNPALWGYTGILTVPTADMSGDQTFHIGARYFPLVTGFGGGISLNLFRDLELGFTLGFPGPNQGPQPLGMGGNIKYRLFNQADNGLISVAGGATLLGLNTANNSSYVFGNNLFLMLSRDFSWAFDGKKPQYFLSTHLGFMGDLSHPRLAGGIEVPILEYAKIKAEYLGPTANIPNQHTLNFGATVTPLPYVDVTIGIMQQKSSDFLNRDFIIQAGYRGNFPFDIRFNPQPTPSATPKPSPSPSSTSNVPGLPGQISGRVVDKTNNTPLKDKEVTLSTKALDKVFNSRTDEQGYFNFKGVPAGEYELLVHGRGWISQSRLVVIQPERETSVQVTLQPSPGQISGKVSFPDGDTNGLKLQLKHKQTNQVQIETILNSTGTYNLSDVSPGDYVLVVSNAAGNSLSNRTITVLPGGLINENLTVIKIVPEASPSPTPTPKESSKPQLSGIITDEDSQQPLQGVKLKIESKDVTILTLTSSDGTYSFRDLPNATYRLNVTKEGYKARIFQVTIRQKDESLTHSITLKKE